MQIFLYFTVIVFETDNGNVHKHFTFQYLR